MNGLTTRALLPPFPDPKNIFELCDEKLCTSQKQLFLSQIQLFKFYGLVYYMLMKQFVCKRSDGRTDAARSEIPSSSLVLFFLI